MDHPFDCVQRIYIINLATRTDRRAEIGEQLVHIGIGLQSANVRLFEAIRPDNAGDFPSIGARGCFMSHLEVLRDAIAAGLERILILEDDLNFSPDFMLRAPAIMARAAAPDCLMFYGGYEVAHGLSGGADPSGCVEVSPNVAVQTTHFLGIQSPAIEAAARYLGDMLAREPGHPDGGPMHVDGAYSWFRRANPQWRTLAAMPKLGYQRASRTDVHDLRWFDKLPGVRSIVAAVRRARNA